MATNDVTGLDEAARVTVEDFGAAPAAVVGASLGRGEKSRLGLGFFGHLETSQASARVGLDTPFDLASVTKPIVALALARLERRGLLHRTERLAEVIPSLRGTASEDIPLDLLAAHRAGLEAHIKIFAPLLDGRSVSKAEALSIAASSRRSDAVGSVPKEGFAPVYSDMGYLLLGAAIEERCGLSLDEVVGREISAPLGLVGKLGSARQLRASRPNFEKIVAPTEDVAFRGGVVRGVVHDENAFAVANDGMCGHAGLFGDVESVLLVGLAVLHAIDGDEDFLSPSELHPLIRDRNGGSLLAGFDRASGETPSAGTRVGPRTFGHLGFTGTSLWIDPDSAFVGVLLTNRVHPTREHIAIRAARPRAYDAMFDALAHEADRLSP